MHDEVFFPNFCLEKTKAFFFDTMPIHSASACRNGRAVISCCEHIHWRKCLGNSQT